MNIKKLSYGEKGFTLVELLVVVAILGVLAAVAVPNIGAFINRGKAESYEAELHNVQTAVMAMLADSSTAVLATSAAVNDDLPSAIPTNDMSLIVTTDTVPKKLSDYMTGLGTEPGSSPPAGTTFVKSGCKYAFNTTGTTIQQVPP